jgi:hypothetical protein
LTKIGPFGAYLARKAPKRTPPYDKKSRGVPLIFGVLGPFFGQILVQNGHFIKVRGSNFIRKLPEI